MRHSNAEKNLVAKKRVIKMLFVVVLEFFICWTPLYALQVGSGRLVDGVMIDNAMDGFIKIKCSYGTVIFKQICF